MSRPKRKKTISVCREVTSLVFFDELKAPTNWRLHSQILHTHELEILDKAFSRQICETVSRYTLYNQPTFSSISFLLFSDDGNYVD